MEATVDYKTLYEEKCKELEAIKASIVGTAEININKIYLDKHAPTEILYVYQFNFLGDVNWTPHHICSKTVLPLTLGICKVHFESNMK